jgi:hypothetical protein
MPPRPSVVGPPADDGDVAVGGQRDGHSLAGASHSAAADQLIALLRPDAAAAGEHPRRLGQPPTDDGGVAVGGQRDGHDRSKTVSTRSPRRRARAVYLEFGDQALSQS